MTQMTEISDPAARAVIERLARAPAVRAALADERRSALEQRRRAVAARDAELDRLRKAHREAEKPLAELQAAAIKARAAHVAAIERWRDADHLKTNASFAITAAEERHAAALRSTADPRIAAVRRYLLYLLSTARTAFRAAIVPRAHGLRAGASNIEEVNAAAATLEQMLADCAAMEVAAYGDDLAERLRAMVDRGAELVRPLAPVAPPPSLGEEFLAL